MHEAEAVAVPLTGWSKSGGSAAVVTFDAVAADLDKKPLLVSSTSGALQLATELHLTFHGKTLRVWRYGQPNAEAFACGKRTIHLLPGGSAGPKASELREATGGQPWHAISADGSLLLELDAPASGVDGLSDVWHVCRAQVALPAHVLYRALAPRLYPQWPAQPAAAARPRHHPSSDRTCELELTLYRVSGERVATTRCSAALTASAATSLQQSEELRRVGCTRVSVDPVTQTVLLSVHADDSSGVLPQFAPRAGIASIVLRQQRQVVATACTHYTGAIEGMTAEFSLGDAVYVDESGVTQREAMSAKLSYRRLRSIADSSFDAELAEVVGPMDACEADATEKADATENADARTHVAAVSRNASAKAPADSTGDGQQANGQAEGPSTPWEVHGLNLEMLVPAEDVAGVSLEPHACDPIWARALRHLVLTSVG